MVPSRTPMRLESSSLPIRTANTDTLLDEIDWAIRQYEIGFEPGKLRLEFMQPRADVRAPKTLGPANAQQPPWLARHASDGILKRLQLLEQIFQFAVVPLPERRSC